MATPDPRGPDLPHPVLQAMLLCDIAIREQVTRKATIVGVFSAIQADRFPFQFTRPCWVYARMMDAEGEYPIRLELVRLDDEMTVGRLDTQIAIADRMAASDMMFQIPGLIFERSGAYEWRLFANGRHLGGMRLNVVQQQEQSQGG